VSPMSAVAAIETNSALACGGFLLFAA
jgi:hypothetical protein